MSYKIAIVGPASVISGFKALGVIPYAAENGSHAVAHIQSLKKNLEGVGEEKVAAVILIESIAEQISKDDMEKISKGALPAIVTLPGIEGSKGAGVAKLKALGEKAVGSDIF